MSRLTQCFNNLQKKGHKALVPFITAGDPTPSSTVSLLHALVEGGADIIELGVPFSDPMADGPVIQKSSERALLHGTSIKDVLNMVAEFRKENTITPVILMGYLNPVEIMGYKSFADKAKVVGMDGVLLVDQPPEEADELQIELKRCELDQIFLLSPTTSEKRLKYICSKASGFLYYVSLKGVTGSDQLDIATIEEKIDNIRSNTKLPVGVGFGIKDAKTASKVAAFSDAIIVGSALVHRISDLATQQENMTSEITNFLSELRLAIDAA
jgi:tryptophan synthase alpha chain